MKVLLDTCVWGGAAGTLRSAGHDVRWMGELEPDPGDDAILQIRYHQAHAIGNADIAA
jgi:hypothetical protein